MRTLTIITLLICCCSTLFSQNNLHKQLPQEVKYNPNEVVDSTYGITIYERLNFRIGGDSVRNCKGYACNGWVEDYYESGQLLHKGYYTEGHVKIYRNYYPSGNLERVFNVIDDFKSVMKIYYNNDTLKSQIKYIGSNASKWEDYHSNGYLAYYEEYNRGMDYHISQKSYYETGKPEILFELVNKKKLLYTKKEFYPTGTPKLEGEAQYSESLLDYIRTGTWKYYDEKGKLVKQEEYINGKVESEKSF